MSAPTFNLVSERWIPVERGDGALEEVSLRQLFEDGANLSRITDASPLVVAALYRLAFAIACGALRIRDQEDWEELWDEGLRADRIGEYLSKYQSRFDLFSDDAPFYQVVDMPESCRAFSWTKLALELPPNSSRLLFDHTTTVDPPLGRPAEVARALVAAQSFIVGAGKSCMGYTYHAPLTAALSVIPEGPNLEDTILANVMATGGVEDRPVWELPPLSARQVEAQQGERSWTGTATRLTWVSRAVRLIPEDDAGGVKWIKFGMGFKPPSIEGDSDPWVAYRVTKEGVRIPRKLDADRMVWRDFHGMLATTRDGERDSVHALTRLGLLSNADRPPPRFWTVLVAGIISDKASVKAWRQERWSVPEALLFDWTRRRMLGNAMELAEIFGGRVASAAWHVAAEQLGGSDRADKREVRAVADALPTTGSYWTSLEGAFQGFLQGLGASPEAAALEWREAIAAAIGNAARATHMALGRDAVALKTWAKVSWRFDGLRRAARDGEGPIGERVMEVESGEASPNAE